LYQLIETNLEKGDDTATATTKATAQISIISALAKSLPGFFKGTKTTVADELGAPNVSGRDGYFIKVDGEEKIFNPELSRATGNATTDEIANGYLMYKNIGVDTNRPSVNVIDVAGLRKDIQDLQQAVKNKPEKYFSEEMERGIIRAIIKTEKMGNTVIKTRYEV